MRSEYLFIFLVFIVFPILVYGFFLVRTARDQDRLKRFTFVSSVVFAIIPAFSIAMIVAFNAAFELEGVMPIRFSDFNRTTHTLVLGLYFAAMAFAVRRQGNFAVAVFWGLITVFNLYQLIIYGNMYVAWKPFDAERLKYPDQVVYAALQLTRGEILFHMITPLIWTMLGGFVVWKSMTRSKQ